MDLHRKSRKSYWMPWGTTTLFLVAMLAAVLTAPVTVLAIEPMNQGVVGNVNVGDQGAEQSASPGGMNQANDAVEEHNIGEAQGGQVQPEDSGYVHEEDSQDLGDIPGADDMTFFDPETIPDSVFPEDADWAFNVPINVTNLPPQVEKLGITCETLYWHSGGQIRDGRWNDAGQERNRVDCGYAKRKIDVSDGGYVGNIVIGVQMTPGAADNIGHAYWLAREYECKMYLVGDLPGENNSWEIPQTGPISPFWRRADANQPFRWWTERQPIPVAAKPNPPWADADGGGIGGINDAMEGMAGQAGQQGQEGQPGGEGAAEGVPAEGMEQNLQNLN